MPDRPSQAQSFRYKGQTYTPRRSLRLRGRLYHILEEWGTRYKAFDVAVQEMRAIRVRKAGVKQEMRLIQLGKIRNHNLPHVYDYYREGDDEYLVHEWFEGYALEHYLRLGRAGKPYFDAERSYFLIRGLATGLARLHDLSIFHGDIKPANIIVASADRLVLTDFGAAWSGARTRLRPNELSPGYASPEQFLEEPLADHRSDQFATSVVLYQLLTGELPYEGWGGAAVNGGTPPLLIPPARKNKQVWKSLDRVVSRGLRLQKSERYPTSAAWLNELKAATPPEPRFSHVLPDQLPGTALLQHLKARLSDKMSRS